MLILTVLTIVLYVACTGLFWIRINQGASENSDTSFSHRLHSIFENKYLLLSMVVLAGSGHCILLYLSATQSGDINLALGKFFSLVSLMSLTVYLFGAFSREIINLGIFVLPIGLAGLLTGLYLPGEPLIVQDRPLVLWLHLAIALLAFGILCVAAAQALLLYVQENQLRSHHPDALFPALPAIQTMETNLFQLTLLGVILLTINLVTGMISSWQVYGKSLEFNHHILLSFIAWLGFSALLAGHKIYGWRGRIAAKWTLVAFAVLILAYFGTRFVTSIILA